MKRLIPLILLLALSSCTSHELSICFTGDLLLDRGVREQIDRKGVDTLFSQVAPVWANYDAVVVNLECPVTARHAPVNKRYVFRAEPQWMPALQKAGITHAAMANNHTYDQGRGGLEDTYRHLQAQHITPIGAGSNAVEACRPVFIRKGSIRVAIFNSVVLPLENWEFLSGAYGICQASVEELSLQIRQVKAKEKCYVVVVLHWGTEYAPQPHPQQRHDARQLIDAGADAIIGHHPHVVQPEETYRGKPIFYSLGNFIFDARRDDARQGIMAGLTFTTQAITTQTHRYEIRQCTPSFQEETYLPDLATTLYNLGILHSDRNEYAQAETAYQEALKIRRELASANPQTYLPYVAMTLTNLGILQRDRNEYAQAAASFQEDLKIRRELASANPQTYLPTVAATLNNLAILHIHRNEYAKAETSFQEALKIYREFAAENPQTHLPDVAMTLNNLGNLQRERNENAQAAASYQEALKIRREFAAMNPQAYLRDLATTLANLAIFYQENIPNKSLSITYAKEVLSYQKALEHIPATHLNIENASAVLERWETSASQSQE
ncbi:MAG: CapA family protein [Tannerellaceae bacterium]|jgi:poly-gamma-glutamate synthesis protein (capsule biosynthesis protein)|nr:CapA family protein [Tannerellaceae bacterium]